MKKKTQVYLSFIRSHLAGPSLELTRYIGNPNKFCGDYVCFRIRGSIVTNVNFGMKAFTGTSFKEYGIEFSRNEKGVGVCPIK